MWKKKAINFAFNDDDDDDYQQGFWKENYKWEKLNR